MAPSGARHGVRADCWHAARGAVRARLGADVPAERLPPASAERVDRSPGAAGLPAIDASLAADHSGESAARETSFPYHVRRSDPPVLGSSGLDGAHRRHVTRPSRRRLCKVAEGRPPSPSNMSVRPSGPISFVRDTHGLLRTRRSTPTPRPVRCKEIQPTRRRSSLSSAAEGASTISSAAAPSSPRTSTNPAIHDQHRRGRSSSPTSSSCVRPLASRSPASPSLAGESVQLSRSLQR